MSGGCYRCGLADGSADRLCETCFRMKYYRGRDVIEVPPDAPIEGLEFSPKVRTFLLSSGAALYVSLVGFVMAAHVLHSKTQGDPRLEFVSNGEAHSIVTVDHEIGLVRGPAHRDGRYSPSHTKG